MTLQEYGDNRQHQDGVEDVNHVFVRENLTRIDHQIVDDWEDASDENDYACEVEDANVLAPGYIS